MTFSDFDARYWAGLFDGEGTASAKRTDGRWYGYVSIALADRLVVDLLAAQFGGSVWTRPPRRNQRASHQWTAAGGDAFRFLSAVAPYLIIKKHQAEIVLEMLNLTRQPSGQWRWNRAAVADIAQRERLAIRLRQLNKRGTVAANDVQ